MSNHGNPLQQVAELSARVAAAPPNPIPGVQAPTPRPAPSGTEQGKMPPVPKGALKGVEAPPPKPKG
jgi:hypothetical protein